MTTLNIIWTTINLTLTYMVVRYFLDTDLEVDVKVKAHDRYVAEKKPSP